MDRKLEDAVVRSIESLAGSGDTYVKSAVELLIRSLAASYAAKEADGLTYEDAGEGWFKVVSATAPSDLGLGDMVELAKGVVYHIATATSGATELYDVCSLNGDRKLVDRLEITAFKRGEK